LTNRGIIGELPEPGCLTFCLGLAPQRGLIGLLKKGWDALINTYPERDPLKPFDAPPFPKLAVPFMPCGSAWRSKVEILQVYDSVGRVSAEMICPYPPGIPMVIPGEILDQKRVEWLLQQQQLWPDHIPSKLRVVSE